MPVISATVEEYYQGAWTATVEQTEAYEGSFELGGYTWVGTATHQEQDEGRVKLQIVGGRGGLSRQVAERQYYGGASVNSILQDILKACGETGSTAVTTRAPSYQRQACTAGQALDYLVKTYGLTWFVTREGTVSVVASRPVSVPTQSSFQVLARDSLGPILQVNSDANLTPGDSWDNQTIRHIRWIQDPMRLVAEVSFKESILKPEGLDYHKTYGAKVERQNSDGTLDVIVNGKFGLSKVKWLAGVPGWVEAKEGDLVSVGFWNADPRQPYAQGIELGSQTQHAIDIGELMCVMGTGPLAAAVISVQYAKPVSLTGGVKVWTPLVPSPGAVPPTPVFTGTPIQGIVIPRSER